LDRRKRKAELFEQMRREYEHGVGTIKRGDAEISGAPADGARGDPQCPPERSRAELTRAESSRIGWASNEAAAHARGIMPF